MKILMVGGGTGGPNSPLAAVAEYIKRIEPKVQFVFVSDGKGPAKNMFASFNSPHYTIPAGKWRRYFSAQNFLDIFKLLAGSLISFFFLLGQKPNVIFSAGSYVSLPIGFAAKVMRIPMVIHQQDVIAARTNKILAKWAKKLTVSVEESRKEFAPGLQNKIEVTGNPVRPNITKGNKEDGLKEFANHNNLPVVLILGGGTGSQVINQSVTQNLTNLTQVANILHLTGTGKARKDLAYSGYQQIEFSNNIQDLYAAADIIVSRAGFSVISELAALKKATILIPIPNTPQERNANFIAAKSAAVVLNQKNLAATLAVAVDELIKNDEKRKTLAENIGKVLPSNGTEKVAKVILEVARN